LLIARRRILARGIFYGVVSVQTEKVVKFFLDRGAARG